MFGEVVPTYRKVSGFDQQSWLLMRKNVRFKLKIPEHSQVFLSVATYEPRKRIEDILKAFNEIDHEDSHLILVGVSSEDLLKLPYLFLRKQAKIHAVGISKNLDDFYAAADCFVFASEEETMPLVLQEAAIHGIPRIVSMYPGHNELIPNKNYAYLYPTGDVSALKDKMNYFIENYENSLVVAELARNFQESKLLENTVKLYELLDMIYENRVSITPAGWSNEKS
jgi:glycosyltransferase involved in cell wall biosynthesis